jgi:hypothetical protein
MGDFKPADVYVGVVELFSVLLPGALLLAAIVQAAGAGASILFSPLLDTDEAQWVAFVFAAYALGAFVFPVASTLDTRLYNPYRQRRWPKETDFAYNRATELRQRFFGPEDSAVVDRPMNTFAWAKTLLMFRAPGAFADVQRYEAESKFFRSLIIVLPVAGVLLAAKWLAQSPALAGATVVSGAVLARLSFQRYAERRQKSTEWAYRYVITLLLSPTTVAEAKASA